MLKIAWSEKYHHELPVGHRFPMEKYTILPEQLMYEGTVLDSAFFTPYAVDINSVLSVHDADYFRRLSNLELSYQEVRKTGFPQSRELIDRELIIMSGSVQAARYALEYGVSMNIAGGTHHAFTNRGEGFCLLNDLAIAARVCQLEGLVNQCLVVDLDVHQGNGTAEIFRGDDSVFTFSMHGKSNYPMHKEMSDLDVELADGTDDKTYLDLLDRHLKSLIDLIEPELILFQSGVDVLGTDKLGRLNLSISGCRERDKIVLELAKSNKIPIVAAMGGGYSEKISDIVEAHANTFRLAQEIYF
jgi:acetoin utilization deacetylase AcuC-like enzyme